MHTDLAPLFAQLEARKRALLEALREMPPDQLQFRPDPNSWSPLQVAEHLMLVERGFNAQLARPRETPTTLRHRIGAVVVWVVMKTGIRVKAPVQAVVPSEAMSYEDLAATWDEVRIELKDLLDAVPAENVGKRLLRHPVAGPMDYVKGLDFAIAHFDRHLRQFERIRSTARFPG
jgi:uncharacterized damage-inducible protein DinB